MKRGARRAGFTIIETLIVLAITGGMFVSAAVMISGRQASTQFSQGVRDIESQIEQAMNEVSNGYYLSTQAIDCTNTGPNGGPLIRSSGDLDKIQGTNKECTFIGKVMQFAVANDDGSPTDPERFNIYTVVGIRTTSDLSGTEGLAPAKPRLLAREASESTSATPDMFEDRKLPYGLTVVDMYYGPDANDNSRKIGAVGFTSGLGSLSGADVSQQVNILAIPTVGNGLHLTKGDGVEAINKELGTATTNPDAGVHICLKSGGTKQSARLSIGGSGRQSGVVATITDSENCQ
ncbi:MAG TPA: type II secretion system protein [Candidatus Saccharimonadales bacterium]|nr:type II secretion system protein [Candidatus Saccharimonadales bacterium]